MILITKTLPLDWAKALNSGDDSILDAADRDRLTKFRARFVSAYGDWSIAWGFDKGETGYHVACGYGVGSCHCAQITFATEPLSQLQVWGGR